MNFRIILLLCLLLIGCFGDDCETYTRKNDIDLEIYDVIEDCYFGMNAQERGFPIIKLYNFPQKIETRLYSLVCYANKGDTLIKKRGSLRYQIKRGDVIKDFYPECGHTVVLDSGKTKYDIDFPKNCGKRRYSD